MQPNASLVQVRSVPAIVCVFIRSTMADSNHRSPPAAVVIHNHPMSDLVDAAREARKHAYAPYSDYPVGAAIRDADGRTWTGCNVENVSYPLSVCAERNAVARMVCEGGRDIAEVAVVTRDGGAPCGGCLQVLMEFAKEPSKVLVHALAETGEKSSYTLAELMPHAFRSAKVNRTER
jgi:cytidine deaminase